MTKLLLLVLLLPGCAVFQSAEWYAALAVDAYCTKPPEARALVRATIARSIEPHRLVMQCADMIDDSATE